MTSVLAIYPIDHFVQGVLCILAMPMDQTMQTLNETRNSSFARDTVYLILDISFEEVHHRQNNSKTISSTKIDEISGNLQRSIHHSVFGFPNHAFYTDYEIEKQAEEFRISPAQARTETVYPMFEYRIYDSTEVILLIKSINLNSNVF